MSEKDVETNEVSMAAPEEAAPAVESEQQPEACADLAQVTGTLGTQTPLLYRSIIVRMLIHYEVERFSLCVSLMYF